MAKQPKRRCGKCRAIVQGDCPSCAAKADKLRNGTEHRQFAQKVYKSKSFRALRERVYERDAATCALCGLIVDWSDYHCDHKLDVAERPELAFDEDNLQVMHSRCHAIKTGAFTKEGSAGGSSR